LMRWSRRSPKKRRRCSRVPPPIPIALLPGTPGHASPAPNRVRNGHGCRRYGAIAANACAVTTRVASALEIPDLAQAVAARGLGLVPYAPGVEAEAALFAGGAGQVAQIRAQGWLGPLLLLLPEGASVARALDAGADDAMPGAAEAEEIAARLAARVRPRPEIVLGDLRIDPVERRVTRAGHAIPLLPREYSLLLHLLRRGEHPTGRAELLAAVWGLGFDPGTNVVEVHVSRLRAKLDRGFGAPMLITDKGRGYRLCAA